MKRSSKAVWAIAVMALAAVAVRAQAAQQVVQNSAPNGQAQASADTQVGGEVLREILDPATGQQWFLERQADRPGGPGRLVMSGNGQTGKASGRRIEPKAGTAPKVVPPVIRAGDRLVVVAHTTVMDAALEAVALAPAQVGSTVPVRLKVGGKVMQAIARGAGRAEWSPGNGERH